MGDRENINIEYYVTLAKCEHCIFYNNCRNQCEYKDVDEYVGVIEEDEEEY